MEKNNGKKEILETEYYDSGYEFECEHDHYVLEQYITFLKNKGIVTDNYPKIALTIQSKQLTDDCDLDDWWAYQPHINHWIKQIKKTYIHTIPTAQLIFGANGINNALKNISEEELNMVSSFFDYSPKQINGIMNYYDKLMIFCMIGDNIELLQDKEKTWYNSDYLKFYLRGNIDVYQINSYCEKKEINGMNERELLFKQLAEQGYSIEDVLHVAHSAENGSVLNYTSLYDKYLEAKENKVRVLKNNPQLQRFYK